MKTPKIAMVRINGKLQSGTVLKENTRTAVIQLNHVGNQPIITKKKKHLRLILGDKWEN
jgi:hypothetical protein